MNKCKNLIELLVDEKHLMQSECEHGIIVFNRVIFCHRDEDSEKCPQWERCEKLNTCEHFEKKKEK